MKQLIFTDHARERMFLRSISKSLIQTTLDKPDKTEREDDGDTQFIKPVTRSGEKRNLHVIAKPVPEQGKNAWLIKTVWIRGEDDPNFIIKTVRMLIFKIFLARQSR
ncbi:MAG: DUF4258 domain-containing protein [Anaerolineae bacterium]|nr:DUF4258 domain-containing protein [Anaerolineae bacterium]